MSEPRRARPHRIPIPLDAPLLGGAVKHARCPMGCGSTLALDDANELICTWSTCPRPTAAAELLQLDTEHYIVVRVGGDTVPEGRFAFSIEHPLRCRLETPSLFDCPLHEHVRELAEWPYDLEGAESARYHAGHTYGRWLFTRVADHE